MIGQAEWNYVLVGRLEDFQSEEFTFLQSEDDVKQLLSDYGIDDEFRNYMVVIKDGEYQRIFGVMGITLDSLVYEYDVI